jgi:hypothetical protein
MSGTTVSDGTTTFNPTLVDGYESTRATATVVHQIMNRSTPDISIRPAALRAGTLRMIFADSSAAGGDLIVDGDGYVVAGSPFTVNAELDSKACEDAHAAGGVFNLVSSERSSIVMSYVADGSITRALDDATRDVWILEVDFHEVGP